MLDLLKEFGLALLQGILLLAIPILVKYAADWLKAQVAIQKARLSAQQIRTINQVARVAVQAAEQIGLAGELVNKKETALNIAADYLEEHDIPINVKLISDAIEAAVMSEYNWDKTQPAITEAE